MIPPFLRRLALALLLALALVGGASALDGYAASQTVEFSACDQAVYQQDVVIHRSAGSAYEETVGGMKTWHLYVGSGCKADYGDIRFTDAAGTDLSYFLWPDYDSSSARFVVRLTGANAAGSLVTWYGNAGATTTSSGTATYLFFDDFLGASLDTTKWNTWLSSGSTTVSDGVLHVQGGAAWHCVGSKTKFAPGHIFEFRVYTNGQTGDGWIIGGDERTVTGGTSGGLDAFGVEYGVSSSKYSGYAQWNAGAYSRVSRSQSVVGSFHRVQEIWAPASIIYLVDGVSGANIADRVPANTCGINFQVLNAANAIHVDFCGVRAYSAAPPTATAFLSGPAPETPPVAAFTADVTSGMAPLAVQFTDASTGTPTAWSWNFGDGGTSDQQHPSHTYNEPGTYTVSLTATNAHGSDTKTMTGVITVYEPGPYYVRTYADLCKVGTGADGWTLDADYIQTADIQCPMDEDFPMICRYPTPFTGTYDGNGYEIQNLQIHTTDSYCGLFVLLGSTAEVRDVHLVDVDIDAYTSRVGALAGESQGQVSECTASGTVSGAWGVGGLIGQMSSGNVTGCIFSGNVSAPSHFGGLIGVMNSGSVEECSSSGFTTGQYNGGLIGQLNGGTVTRCNSSVRVIGNSCGGLIGQMTAGSVAWCNATGDVGALVSDGSDFGRGGLVGWLGGGTLSDSSATGSISGSNHLGGFVGYGSGMITRCFATGGIQRSIGCSEMFLAGGFVGRLDDGTLTECYATGDVLNASYLSGGFLGAFEYGSVTDSYATGDVTVVVAGENRHAGGFIGRWGVWRNGPAGSITNCYSTGHVTAPAGSTDVGGFVGGLDTVSGPPATTSYWDTETSGQAASTGGAVGKTTAEMKTLATFAGWNIATPATYTDEVWYIVEGEDYPRLAWQGLPTLPPVAAFSAAPTSGIAPLTVQFTDASTNDPTAWSWNFGDGGTSDQQHPSHTYNEPGTYTVSLTATNAGGSDTKTKTGHITVTAPILPPVAGFWASPTTGTAPLTVQFTDASTNAPTTWSWNFGDGRTSIAQSPSHTYSTAGTYTVALTVTNAGGSDTETKNGYITVSAAPPTAPTAAAGSPAFPYSQQRKETLSFLLMCWGALAFVGVFCVVIFLLMNGAQRGSGGI